MKFYNCLSLSAICQAYGFFFLKKCFIPILMTTFHGYYETKLCQTELTCIIWYQMIARAVFRAFFWQCLLHRPGFQHLIAAAPSAPVFSFCGSIYYLLGYLSSWHRCSNPNSNHKFLRKKKRIMCLNSSLTLCLPACTARINNPTLGSASMRACHDTVWASHSMCQSAVFKSKQ